MGGDELLVGAAICKRAAFASLKVDWTDPCIAWLVPTIGGSLVFRLMLLLECQVIQPGYSL